MNIGIFVANLHAHTGGGYVYQNCLLDELLKHSYSEENRHKFTFFHDKSTEHTGCITEINSIDINVYNGRLNEAALRNNIDIIWFLSIVYEHTDLPFILPVWDLQHRTNPCFPEVSSCGELTAKDDLYNHFLPRATFILAGTGHGKEEIAFYYNIPREKICVNPLPLPRQISNPLVRLPVELAAHYLGKNTFLFYPAQFWPHKNHVVLLETLEILKHQYGCALKLVLTGSDRGNLEFILQKISNMGLNDDVVVLGFVSTEAICWLYQNAFALLYPSYFGPDNIPPLEAFSAGCPVIGADIPGAREQLDDAAILVDPCDEVGFAQAVLELYHTPQLREDLIQKGASLVKGRTANAYVQNTLELIDRFSVIRRCWGPQTIIHYLTSFPEWVQKYKSCNELCMVASLLDSCSDNTTDQLYHLCLQILLEIKNITIVARTYLDLSDYPTAERLLMEVIAQCSDYAPAYACLALIHERLHNSDKTNDYTQKARYSRSRLSSSRLFDCNGVFLEPVPMSLTQRSLS